jgi:hypothetical protein
VDYSKFPRLGDSKASSIAEELLVWFSFGSQINLDMIAAWNTLSSSLCLGQVTRFYPGNAHA